MKLIDAERIRPNNQVVRQNNHRAYNDSGCTERPRTPQASNGPRPNNGNNSKIGRKMNRNDRRYRPGSHNDDYYEGHSGQYQDPRGHSERYISETGFRELVRDVRNTDYDHDKQNLIKYAADNHSFTSKQVKELLRLLDYDHSRLEIAKYAYRSVVDPNNFNMVFSEFDYDHSVRSLVDHIKKG